MKESANSQIQLSRSKGQHLNHSHIRITSQSSHLEMQMSKLLKHLPSPIKRLLVKADETVRKARIEFQSMTAQINPSPIFVLGNQKSGTSAIAILLAEMTGLSLSMDLTREYLSTNQTWVPMQRGEISFEKFLAINKASFSSDIVKEANLTILYEELVKSFPAARFIFVLRDPRSNIRSILNRIDIPGNLPRLDCRHLSKVTRGWDIILDGRWLGLNGENYIEFLAARWNLMIDVYLGHQQKMILARYEDFVKAKIDEITRIAQSLGLAQINEISDKVDVQFQPKGNAEVSWREFFGDDNLARIETICGDRMKLLDYPLSVRQESRTSSRNACN